MIFRFNYSKFVLSNQLVYWGFLIYLVKLTFKLVNCQAWIVNELIHTNISWQLSNCWSFCLYRNFFFYFTRLHAPLSAAVLRHGGPVYKWKAQSIMDQRAWVVTTRSIDVTRLLWEAPAEGLYIYNQQQPNNNNKKEEIYPPNYLHLLFHPTPASIRWDQSGTFPWLFFCTV